MPVSSPHAIPTVALALSVAFAFVWGANIGSFLNVVAHRLPLGLSVVRPRSRCPLCRTRIGALDNLPILSWALLGARCRGCKTRISWRYPAVEALAGLLSANVFYVYVIEPAAWARPGAWLMGAVAFAFVAALLAASLIDADHKMLPDKITIPGMWAGPAVCAVFPRIPFGPSGLAPDWIPSDLPLPLQAALFSVAGIGLGAGGIWLLGKVGSVVFRKQAMGFGDVKLLGMIGGFVGPLGALIALVLAAFAGSAFGAVALLRGKQNMIPFGPYLAFGAYIQLLYGFRLVAVYVDFVQQR